jgi:23S rRNA (pseudouridine1915-N3)-methyltransferase
MKWQVLTVGRPNLGYARDGIELYCKRIRPMCALQIRAQSKDQGSEINGRMQLNQSAHGLRIAIDERGQALTTEQWVARVNQFELQGLKQVSLLIGGADGHSDATRSACDEIWSLSGLTLQHELALVVLLEQLYRIYAIKSGHPYHR